MVIPLVVPGNTIGLPDKSKLPDKNNPGRPGNTIGLSDRSKDVPVTRPINRDNNVLSDKDGN